jgi:hypothetical protein
MNMEKEAGEDPGMKGVKIFWKKQKEKPAQDKE